jgi:sulfur carrier protein
MASMRVDVNGVVRELAEAATVHGLVAELTPERRGVAVAVNGEVVPRSQWAAAILRAGDRVEVLTAAQGG